MATGDATTAPTFAEKLRALRNEHGISLRGLARQTNYDPGYLSHVANGHKRPSAQMAKALDEALNAGGELEALRPPPRVRTKPKPSRHPNDDPVGTVDQSPTPDQGDDVKRRAALQLLTAISAGAAIPPGVLEEIFAGVEDALSSDRADVDRWERTAWEYGHVRLQQAAGTLINDLAADIVQLGRLLNRRQAPLESARLLRVSAELSGLLAMEFNSLGDRRAARIAWAAATRAADHSGDRDLSSWVRAKEADGALWAGLPLPIASSLADEAVEVAKGRPAYGLVRAHTVRADLAAEQGDKPRARAALKDLAHTLEHVPDGTTADPSGHVGEVFLKWHEAYVYTLIKDDRAANALESGIDLMSATGTGRAAAHSLLLIRGLWLVRDREIDAGLQQAVTAIESGHSIDPATRRHLTRQILRALPERARTLPATRELRALTTTPA